MEQPHLHQFFFNMFLKSTLPLNCKLMQAHSIYWPLMKTPQQQNRESETALYSNMTPVTAVLRKDIIKKDLYVSITYVFFIFVTFSLSKDMTFLDF